MIKELYSTVTGNSLTFGLLFPETYEMANTEKIAVYLDNRVVQHTVVDKMIRVELQSDKTINLFGSKQLAFVLDDVSFGVLKQTIGEIKFSNIASTFNNESVNSGYNFVVKLSINETTITTEDVLYEYVKGKDGVNGTTNYNELTNKPDLSVYQTVTDNGLETVDKTIVEAINEVNAIAKGKSAGWVFADEATLNAWLLVPENVALLTIGDNFYIVDTETPDYWWDGTAKQELETKKVDLTEYYTKTEIDAMLGNYYTANHIDTLLSGKSDVGHTHDDRYYTESEVDTLLSGKQPTGNYVEDSSTTDTTILDTDVILKKDSVWKSITWANVKSLLQTWANGLYVKLNQTTAQTIGSTTNRLAKLWASEVESNTVVTGVVKIPTSTATSFQLQKEDGTVIMVVDSVANIVRIPTFWTQFGSGYQPNSTFQHYFNKRCAFEEGLESAKNLRSGKILFGAGLWGSTDTTFAAEPASPLNLATSTSGSVVARLRVQPNGNITIGTTTDNGIDKLQVNGSSLATTAKGGDTTNYGQLDANGIRLFGAATQHRDEYPSGAWVNAAGGAAPDEVSVTIAGIATRKQAFNGAATTESKSNMFEIPHDMAIDRVNAGTDAIEFHIHGMPSTTGAGTARFTFRWCYSPPNGNPIAMTAQTVDFVISANTQYKHMLSGVDLPIPAGGYAIGGKIDFTVERNPADAADTYADVFLFDKCALHVPLDTIGSFSRYGKYS